MTVRAKAIGLIAIMLRRDLPCLLQQGEGRIEHRIVGAIDDALWTPVSVQEILGVIQSSLSLFQSVLYQGGDFLSHTRTPSVSTARTNREWRSGPRSHSL